MRRRSTALLAAAACWLVAAPPAYAKPGVIARLDAPASLVDAAAGSRVRVSWTLTAAPRPPVDAPAARPVGPDAAFGADGVYIRVRGRTATAARIFRAISAGRRRYPRGRYVAQVEVPAGGVRAIAIGLDGWRIVPGRPPMQADVFFPIDNDPFAAREGRAAAAAAPWLGGAIALALALGLSVVVRRHRVAHG